MAINSDSNNSLALADLHRPLANSAQVVVPQQPRAQVPHRAMRMARPVALDAGALATTSWYRIAPHRLLAILFMMLLSSVHLLNCTTSNEQLRYSLPAI